MPGSDGILVRRIRIRVDGWEPPARGWRGAVRPLRDLVSLSLAFDIEARRAEIEVRLGTDTRLSDIARAVLPALVPDRRRTGSGAPRIALRDDADETALALLPSLAAPPSTTAAGDEGLARSAELVLGAHGTLSAPPWVSGTAPTETRAVVAGHRVVIDLMTHNPIGRMASFSEGTPGRRLARVDGRIAIERLEGDRTVVDAVLPLDRPITRDQVSALRSSESLSVAAIDRAPDRMMAARLAELAACGVILYDLPATASFEDMLDPDLVSMMRLPYAPTLGLEREVRSVSQRRTALLAHAGAFRLARAAEGLGHPILPAVSVIVSSRRPHLVPRILRHLAAQTYERLEVVVVMHGVQRPDLDDVRDEIGGLDYLIVDAPPHATFGEALAEGVRRSSGDLVTKADDDDHYGGEHVRDLVLAWLYSRAELVGKPAAFVHLEGSDITAHRRFGSELYHDQVAGGTMLLARGALDELGGWRPTPALTDRTVLDAVAEAGGTVYRTHDLGYVYVRSAGGHTWQRTDAELLDGSYERWPGLVLPGFEAD
ncbi:glycosyltransferase [Agromyces sp. GXS1127]|uniref:glycosyltransferase n=1 Tax=Agromyces sp. GXS1127 TaxID=3424181 RepID=UPI003D310B52